MVGLVPEADFDMDEAKKTINATESGLEKIEAMLGIDDIYADPASCRTTSLQQALKAQFLFHRDVDYVVVNGEVKIVDEFTGRIMEGRRYSEGLHQAPRRKSACSREENPDAGHHHAGHHLYEKLSGMTGTAMTEDAEFREIYKPVVAIPPNRPVARKTRTTSSTARWRRSSTPWPTTWPSATRRASPASSAPCPSRAPSCRARLLDKRHHMRPEREEPRARGTHHRRYAWAP